MGLHILREEAGAFRRAAADVTILEPRHRTTGEFGGKYLHVRGVRSVDLSGLDYLALGSDPAVKQIMRDSLEQHDCAIPGSAAVIQTGQSHELECALGRFHLGGQSTAVTFSAGYSANFSIMEALGLRTGSRFITMHQRSFPQTRAEPIPSIFFLDGDMHFSARHGLRFAQRLRPDLCTTHTYRPGDFDHLEKLLRQSQEEHGDNAVRFVLTDTLESATGREYDLSTLCDLAETYDCMVYADEAHAVGVLGPQGRGVAAGMPDFDRHRDRLLIMGTLTKTLCQPGGYVAMSDPALAAMLRFTSPQHVFSAPIPPWIAAAATRLIDLVAGTHGDQRRQRLRDLSRYARTALREAGFEVTGHPETPILAIPLRDPSLGDKVLEWLGRAGFIVSVFQAPLMPTGRELLRLAMRADLTEEDLDRLARTLVACRQSLPFT